jgi:signal transduction histidine kinase/ligand-binding sensor domain-containing protein
LLAAALACTQTVTAAIFWSDLGATLALNNGPGTDILGGAVKRDQSSSGVLYFKFHVDPQSDMTTEEYFAAFQLYEGDHERLAVGNSLKAWAYSAFNTLETGEANKVSGDIDLRSSHPEPSSQGPLLHYELPRRGTERTIVFKVQYRPDEDDLVTVWLDPDLTRGATESTQPESLTTTFKANASFDQIRLRHGGGGPGWTFSDMAIATTFTDFINAGASETETGRLGSSVTLRLWLPNLPENSVRALTQTRDGYLWIGSDEGVARFDGIRFTPFGLREGFATGPVTALFEDHAGALWVGTTGGGLVRWQNGKAELFNTRIGLPSDSITALAEDDDGRLWVGTESGLAILHDSKPVLGEVVSPFKNRPIPALFKDRHSKLWVGATGLGVFKFEGNSFSPVTDPFVDAFLQDPHCLLVDKAGRLWLGAGDYLVLCHENDQWRRFWLPRHLAKPYATALIEQPDGTVWAGSAGEGLFRFSHDRLSTVNASSGLSDNLVQSLLVDTEGNLWVGASGGLNRLRLSNFSVLGQNEGLRYGPVFGLAEVAQGTLWAGKPADGLYTWGGRSFNRIMAEDSSPNYSEINSLLATRDGSCWAGGARGLLHFNNPKDSPAPPDPTALAGSEVISLAEGANVVWAGTADGTLWCLRAGAWSLKTNYCQKRAITALAPGTDGSIWVGTDGAGLTRFKDAESEHLDKTSGLLSDVIRTLYLDAQNTLWIGSAGGGLSRLQNGLLTTFTTREKLPDNTISQILEDDTGNLWLGTSRGIACVSKRELDEFDSGKSRALYPQTYSRAEGMPSEECSGGFCPAGLKTKSGLLWFPTSKGIVVIDPRAKATEAAPPVVHLEETLVDGVPNLQPSEIRMPPGNHHLEFHYTGLSFAAPEQVRFRYKLEGVDPDWVEARERRTASYGPIPAGHFTFRVTACNGDGVWSQAGAAQAITVLPRFWQTWWFISLGGLGLVASVGGAARLVEQRKHQRRFDRLEQERALERERARIAQDLHDDLGSSLTRISLLSDLARADKEHPSQVEVHAQKISQSAAQTVRALEEIVWALRPGSDSLQSLVEYIAHFGNELFEDDTARCRLDLPQDLPAQPLQPEMRHNIFLIVKEALTNALKHAGAREVRVQAKAGGDWLEILVQDDGRGFNPGLPAKPGKQHGLPNMRERAEAMNGKLEIHSDPGKGTFVRLKVPFPNGA